MCTFKNPLVSLLAILAMLGSTSCWAKEAFELVSLANDGSLAQSFYNGDHSKITPDGRYVVFRSSESKFVTPNTTGYQVYLRDRKLGTTELISINNQGVFGNNSSDWPSISNDGCRVAFESYSSNLVPADTNGVNDVFVRDRCTTPMQTTRVNLNSAGGQSNGAAYKPSLSGNGKVVAFNAYGNDLIIGISDRFLLYLYDLEQQTTTLLSESAVHFGQGVSAYNPAVSYDGTRIAFYSASTELVTGVIAGWNVFLYDVNSTPHIRLVSSDANGIPQDFANGDGPYPGISDDGHYVSFYSNAHNLVPNDTNNQYDVFVKNVDTNEIWRASVSSSGMEADYDTQNHSTLSKDGTWVSFWTEASNLVSDTAKISRLVVLHNIHTGETRRVLGVSGETLPAISGDLYGRFISNFWGEKLDSRRDSAGVFVYDRHYLPIAIAKIDASTTLPVHPNDTVILDGSSSHNNANSGFFAPKATPSLLYTWTQTAGNSVTFNDPHAIKPNFIAPDSGSYSFRLVVNDTVEDSTASTVNVQVASTAVNVKPTANAGSNQTVALGSPVQLDGSNSSDPDGQALTYSWSQISGLSLTLTGANTATPSFTPIAVGLYSFRLVVNDGQLNSSPATVSITVTATAGASTLVANAGFDVADWNVGDAYRLDGSNSQDTATGNNRGLSYKWRLISAPSNSDDSPARFKISSPTGAKAQFVPPLPGDYQFGLIVSKKIAGQTSSSEEGTVLIHVNGSITVTSPFPEDLWFLDNQSTASIQWDFEGISASKQLAIILCTDGAACSKGAILKKGIKAGNTGNGSFPVKLKNTAATRRWVTDQGYVLVCLPSIGGNDALCGANGPLIIAAP
jgi:hypothetical protein